MARTRRKSSDGSPGAQRRGGFTVPGIYVRLLERGHKADGLPDPRWRMTKAAQRGKDCPPQWWTRSVLLPALEAGQPVELPSWRLGGSSEPHRRIRNAKAADRSIVGWTVYSDDVVVPIRKAA